MVLSPCTFRWLLCPVKQAWHCFLWADRPQVMPPYGPALVGSLIQVWGERRSPLCGGVSWHIAGLKAVEWDTDNNVTAGRCPKWSLEIWSRSLIGWDGSWAPSAQVLQPLWHRCQFPVPQLDAGLMGGGLDVWKVVAWFLSCVGSVLAATLPLPFPALLLVHRFWQEPV